jgi:hypothetical protein
MPHPTGPQSGHFPNPWMWVESDLRSNGPWEISPAFTLGKAKQTFRPEGGCYEIARAPQGRWQLK